MRSEHEPSMRDDKKAIYFSGLHNSAIKPSAFLPAQMAIPIVLWLKPLIIMSMFTKLRIT